MKLELKIEALRVETFATDPATADDRGTVRAHAATPPDTCFSGDWSCIPEASCGETCRSRAPRAASRRSACAARKADAARRRHYAATTETGIGRRPLRPASEPISCGTTGERPPNSPHQRSSHGTHS